MHRMEWVKMPSEITTQKRAIFLAHFSIDMHLKRILFMQISFSWPILAMLVKVDRIYKIQLELENAVEPYNIYKEV